MMGVIICHSMKEGNVAVVTGKGVIKGVVEFKRRVLAKAGTFKCHT